MSELSPRARWAIEALQDDVASDEEGARVRARLAALGVAVSASLGAASVANAAATAQLSGSLLASVPAPSLSGGAGAGAAATGATLGATGASKAALLSGGAMLAKLSSLPIAIKAGAVVIALAGAGVVTMPAAPLRPQTQRETLEAPAGVVRENPATMPRTERRDPPVVMQLEAAPLTNGGADASVAPAPIVERSASEPAARPIKREAVEEKTTASLEIGVPDSASASEGSGSELSAESELLAAALRALRAGRADQARALLDEHQRTFGMHALLARERERMRRELAQTLR